MVSMCSDPVLASSAIEADRRMQSRIVTQLAQSHHQALRKLAVEVKEGSVTLRGHVRWFYEKQLAIQQCQAAGSRQLIDAVEVASAS